MNPITKIYTTNKENTKGISARGYTTDRNAKKVLDSDLLEDIETIYTSHNKQLVLEILEGQIVKVKGMIKSRSDIVYLTNPPQYDWNHSQEAVDGYNRAIEEVIEFLHSAKEEITKQQ